MVGLDLMGLQQSLSLVCGESLCAQSENQGGLPLLV